ncbi:MAG: amidohydrolase family protein [Bryobacteraceae bacterium]
MFKIDAHHHFWKYDPAEYGWIGPRMSAIQRDFLPEDLRKEIAGAGINGVISVQARQTLQETSWLLELADENDFVQGAVGWAPLTNPSVARMLEQLASRPKLRAIRHVLHDEPDDDYMLREDFNRGIRALQPLGLAYDILIFERHLLQTIQFVDRHPNQVFIVDHLAKPRVKSREISPWRESMRELARRPNVYCKISGLATEADYADWTEEQLRPYMETVLHAFGPRRTMFGSDWPVCLVAVEYRRWAHIVAGAVSELSPSEQERFWSGTATEAYRLRRG